MIPIEIGGKRIYVPWNVLRELGPQMFLQGNPLRPPPPMHAPTRTHAPRGRPCARPAVVLFAHPGTLPLPPSHAKKKIAGRMIPFLVLDVWDKIVMACAGAMPYRQDFLPLPGYRHFKLKGMILPAI